MDRNRRFGSGNFRISRKTRLIRGDVDITPLIDCVFLLLIFFMLSASFVRPAGIKVNLPRTVTADILQEEKFIIIVTADNIIHFEGQPISVQKLKTLLKQSKSKIDSILIKADKAASLGKIIEVWDVCRDLGIERLNIATLQVKGD